MAITYDKLIPRLDNELRDEEAWPSGTSKLDEQLNLLYNAALAIGKTLPLARLSLADSSVLSGTSIGQRSEDAYDVVKKYPIPNDAFSLRFDTKNGPIDLGIAYFLLDGHIVPPDHSIPKNTLLSLGNRKFQGKRKLLALDYGNGLVYASNVTELKVNYVASFTRPKNTTGNPDSYDTLQWPFNDDNDTERAVHLVAAHVSGVTIRDPAMAQFQSMLEETYD